MQKSINGRKNILTTLWVGLPYIVSYLEPSWIHVGMNRKPGVAEFFTFKKSGQKQLQQDAEEFNMSMGDYLFSLLADSESNLDDYLECDVNE